MDFEKTGKNLYRFTLPTGRHSAMIDVTAQVRAALRDSGIQEGVAIVYVPHTTAGVTINENADPDVQHDFLQETGKIVPWEDGYRHREGNSAAHIKSSAVGFSQNIIVTGGRLLLGTWQGIYFMEFDGPRARKFFVKLMEG